MSYLICLSSQTASLVCLSLCQIYLLSSLIYFMSSVICPLSPLICLLSSSICLLYPGDYMYMQEVEQLWAEKREKERRIAQLELELDQAGTDHHYSTQPKTDLFCSLLEERLIQHHLQSPCLLKPLSPKAPVS